MGVLDDAIREHLDLKRQRGADPSEVERQAAEALGPARREPPAAPAVEPVDAEVEAGVEPVEPVDDVPAAEPPTQLAEELVPPAEPEVQAAEPGFELEPEPETAAPPAPAEPAFELAPEPDPAAPPTEVREPEAEVTPLHPVEEQEDEPDEVPADERLADDGPLDFPEQKRQDKPLWFEQSPGRDLDFDD